jgi:hypothetical protein
MPSEVDHEFTEDRSYPLTRLTPTVAALAKDSESPSSDVTISAEESPDNFRSSLNRILKAILEAFGEAWIVMDTTPKPLLSKGI